ATRRARKSTAGDPCWLARPGRRQHFPGEGRGEHERLQLQHRVHQPQHPRVTWIPRGVAGGHRNRYPAAQPAPRFGTATLVAVEPVIRAVRDRGVTTVLVTHDMQEAQHLCDQVALVDAGRIVAIDTPSRLAEPAAGGKVVRLRPSAAFDESLLTALPEVSSLEHDRGLVVVTGEGDLANAVILTLGKVGVSAHDLAMESGALEDAFLALTGRGIGKADQEAAQAEGVASRGREHRAFRGRRVAGGAPTTRAECPPAAAGRLRAARREPVAPHP